MERTRSAKPIMYHEANIKGGHDLVGCLLLCKQRIDLR